MKFSIEHYGVKCTIETEYDDVTLSDAVDYQKDLLKCAGYRGVDDHFEGDI